MIKINGKFIIERDGYCWILTESVVKELEKGKNAGDIKEVSRDTYYPNFPQLAATIIERCAGKCETVEELKELFQNAVNMLSDHLNVVCNKKLQEHMKTLSEKENKASEEPERKHTPEPEPEPEIKPTPIKKIVVEPKPEESSKQLVRKRRRLK